jgi:hypothetical protein
MTVTLRRFKRNNEARNDTACCMILVRARMDAYVTKCQRVCKANTVALREPRRPQRRATRDVMPRNRDTAIDLCNSLYRRRPSKGLSQWSLLPDPLLLRSCSASQRGWCKCGGLTFVPTREQQLTRFCRVWRPSDRLGRQKR